jgi:hypothetical protein
MTPRWLGRGAAGALILGATYLATLLRPQLLFSRAHHGTAIQLRSDEGIPDAAAALVALAESRIRESPLFEPSRPYPVYVCNTRWRWNYFSAFDDRSRAFQTPLGRAVFTRRAVWDRNQLAGPTGRDGPRTLDVYLAHEVTHTMVADRLGLIRAARLPAWLREGYAEYVARHGTFDYAETRARLIAGEEDLVFRHRDPYLKYLLLVTHLLEHESLDLASLLNNPPDPLAVEARVRASVR